jgi:hypothetical protein
MDRASPPRCSTLDRLHGAASRIGELTQFILWAQRSGRLDALCCIRPEEWATGLVPAAVDTVISEYLNIDFDAARREHQDLEAWHRRRAEAGQAQMRRITDVLKD